MRNKELFARCHKIGLQSDNPKRVEEILSIDPNGDCEKYSVKLTLSSGPVLDSEVVGRWVYTPPHVTKPLPGELCDSYFEDIISNGLSVQRYYNLWKFSKKKVHKLGHEPTLQPPRQAESGETRPQRKYLGVIRLPITTLREMRSEHGEHSAKLRIYDTAIPKNHCHGEAILVNSENAPRKTRSILAQQMRTRLMVLAQNSGIDKSPHIPANDPDLLALNISINPD